MKRVLFPFSAVHDDEISLYFNDIVTVKEENIGVDGWCEIIFKGKTGKAPIKILEDLGYHAIGVESLITADFLPPNNNRGQYLSVRKNEKIQVVERYSNGWDVGYSKDHIGLFPSEISEISRENAVDELSTVNTIYYTEKY